MFDTSTLKNRIPALLAMLIVALSPPLLINCGGDSTTDPGTDGGNGGQERVITVSLDAASGAPGSRIVVEGIPADVDFAYARVSVTDAAAASSGAGASASDEAGVAMIRRTASGDELVVPVHPSAPMDGGTVEIEVTNGIDLTSNLLTLEIAPLPPAPGAFNQVISKLEALLDGWIGLQGTNAQALRTVTADQLSPFELPLLLFHAIINHPDNPNSLRALADGDIPFAEGEPIDRELLDAIAGMSRLDELIDTKQAYVDTLTPPQASVRFLRSAPSRAGGPFDCVDAPDFEIDQDDCYKLAEVMAYQQELRLEKMGAVQQMQDDAIDALTSALGYARGALIAWGIVNTLWAADNIEAGSMGIYPSSFMSERTDFDADKEEFPEDFTSPGKWSNFRVTAVSEGWRFDDVLKEAFDKAKGLEGHDWDDEALQDFWEEALEKNVDDYEQKMHDNFKNLVFEKVEEELQLDDLTKLEYCSQIWPNIDCTGKPFSDGSSPALDVNNEALTYEPSAVGSTTLKVETSSLFGRVTPTAETKAIETKMIQVFVDPFQANADVSQALTFRVRVENAEDETVEWYPEGTVPADFAPSGGQVEVITPPDPWGPPIIVKARSMANTGLRENQVNTDPREGSAPINYGGAEIILDPLDACLKPGESETFFATVIGIEDQSVTWSTDPPGTGSFSGSTYTAPGTNAGTVVIIATSTVNENVMGYAPVRVGGCECWWTANITGDRSFYWTGTNSVYGTEVPGFVSFVFESWVDGPGIHYPVVNAVIQADGSAIGTFPATGTIEANATDIWFPGDPDDGSAQPQVTITSNDGETITGRVSGPYFRPRPNTNPPEFEKLNLNLGFKATDGTKALCSDD